MLGEARRPTRIRTSPHALRFIVGTVCVGAFMGQLDASIVTIALPHIATNLRAPVAAVEWVSLSYLLVLVCALPAVGRLADRLGRKLLYVDGFIVFTLGSLLCALAPNLGWLIAARALQGFGAALLQANSVALIREALPDKQLGWAIGIQGTAQAIGLALGPAVGGALVSLGGWRLLFLVNVPAGLIGGALGWVLLPRSRLTEPNPGRFDLAGAALLAGAAGGVLFVLSRLRELTLGELTAIGLGCVALAVAFVVRETRVRAPLVDLRLLADRRIGFGLVGALTSFMVMFGALFAIPFYLEARGVSAALAGIELAALPVALGVAAPFTGRLADRRPASSLMAAAMTLTGAGLGIVGLWHTPTGLILGLLIAGAGLGGFIPANNAMIMGAAPRRDAGVLSGVLNMSRGLGTALGVAVGSVVYDGVVRSGGAPAAAAGHGLSATLLVLAGAAVCAGLGLSFGLGRRVTD